MKILFTLMLAFVLSGCATTTPNNSSDAAKLITVKADKFNGTTEISMPLMISRKGFTDTFPVSLAYRATLSENKVKLLQLYVTAQRPSWGFYHSANDDSGAALEFVKVDGEVGTLLGAGADPRYNQVTVTEHFAINLTQKQLETYSKRDTEIKVYGKRDEGVFTVPVSVSLAFSQKLNCVISGAC